MQGTRAGRRRGVRVVLATAAAAILGAVAANPAGAAFPGRNGSIAYVAFPPGGDGEIYKARPDGSHRKRLTNNDLSENAPSYSPNGRRITFTRDVDPTDFTRAAVFVMRADGSHAHRVTHGLEIQYGPTFSPNGKRIVYADYTGIAIVNTDGSHQHHITSPGTGSDNNPVFSPNGKRIAFDRADVDFEIFTMDPHGHHKRQLTHNTRNDFDPAYSPGGGRIAWTSDTDGNTDISVMKANGHHKRNLTRSRSSAYESAPAFSPSGTQIAFASSPVNPGKRGASGDDFEVFRMRANGSHRRAVTHDDIVDDRPDWQPRRRRHHH